MQFNALQALQAGELGRQHKREREYENALSAAGKSISSGDYRGAANALLPHDLNAGLGVMDYANQQQQAQAQSVANESIERDKMLLRFAETLRGMEDPAQRLLEGERFAQTLQIDPPQYHEIDNAVLDSQIQGLRLKLGDNAPALPEAPTATSTIGKINQDLQNEFISQEQADAAIAKENAPRAPAATVMITGDEVDTRPMVGTPPAGFQRVWDEQNQTYRDVPIPGSEAEREAQAHQDKADSRNNSPTVGTLINAYATLNNNKAIRSRQNSAGENIGAIYSKSPVGRFQDAIGGDIGNSDNDAARDTIEGVSMNALMQMISMSDVSAKAMDSDAEMKAWLGAIKGDNFESALIKLHVLDKSFGSGMELQRAYESGQIDLETYEYVTNRANTDPMAIEMGNRMQRYAALEQSVGSERLTPDEARELQQLRQWKASQNAG